MEPRNRISSFLAEEARLLAAPFLQAMLEVSKADSGVPWMGTRLSRHMWSRFDMFSTEYSVHHEPIAVRAVEIYGQGVGWD